MADGTIPTPAPGPGRLDAPDEVWAQVREDYLAGLSAPACARRHGVGVSTLRARARTEGWRRADQAWTPPDRGLDPWDEGVELELRVDGDLNRIEMRELAWVAWRRMMRAVLRGDAMEALRWRRVRLAMDEEEAEVQRYIDEEDEYQRRLEQAEAAARADQDGQDGQDGSDGSDGVSPGSAPLGEGDPPEPQAKAGGGTPVHAPPAFVAPPGLERKGLAFPHDLLRLRPLRPRLPLRPGGEQRPRLVHRPPRRL